MKIQIRHSERVILVITKKRWFVVVQSVIGMVSVVVRYICKLIGFKYKGLFVKGMSGWAIGIYTGTSPVQLCPPVGRNNPVLTASEVTDVRAVFVADPFMIQKDAVWHMFFEVYNASSNKGEIGHAISEDGFTWRYTQIVLKERRHISYPFVFEWNGEYYMIPESLEDYSIRLYKAVRFPDRWSFVAVLLRGRYADTTLIQYQRNWWMFTGAPMNNDFLRLYRADTPLGPWYEHPGSPIVSNNKSIARPGGRIVLTNGKIIRYAQDDAKRYGSSVRAFEITKLTTQEYEEHEVSASPIVEASGKGWNKRGMHTVDPHLIGECNWIAAVDGFEEDFLFVRY